MKKFDPRLLLIVSMTVFGTLGLFVRNISVSSGELALYRAVLAALLIGVYLLVSRQRIPFARIKKEVPLLLLSGAAVFYATVILLNKSIHQVDGIHRTFLQFLSAIVVLIPYVLSTSGITLGSLSAVGWVDLLIVGLVHTGVTYCLYFSSLKELPGQEAAILSYIDPLVAVLVSVALLGERMSVTQVIGGALILGFTLLNELSPAPKAEKQ